MTQPLLIHFGPGDTKNLQSRADFKAKIRSLSIRSLKTYANAPAWRAACTISGSVSVEQITARVLFLPNCCVIWMPLRSGISRSKTAKSGL